LGVVLFQEQVLRLAMELGGFSASEADELRRAIGFTRTPDRMNRMKDKLAVSLARNGVAPESVTSIITALSSFALYGFPESHAISFALIAYASAWLKVHRAAAFYAGLLNNQPMGFYSPASLVQDARRHQVRTLPVCIQESQADCRVIDDATIRLGFNSVRGLRDKPVVALLEERKKRPFSSTDDFFKRTHFSAAERRILSGTGALNILAGHRRAALWHAEAAQDGDDRSRRAAAEEAAAPAPLEPMTYLERVQADYALVGLTTGRHPMSLLRSQLPGILTAASLRDVKPRTRVSIGGSVITRQRPGTAKGFCFITLEDETGHANAIVRPALFEECRLVINLEAALIITGRLQNEEGVIHIMAESITAMPVMGMPEQASHDYH
jgi:error-prone DNA polymerase